jgi:hypothetical protein
MTTECRGLLSFVDQQMYWCLLVYHVFLFWFAGYLPMAGQIGGERSQDCIASFLFLDFQFDGRLCWRGLVVNFVHPVTVLYCTVL